MCLVILGAKRVGVNPKVNNMVQGYEFARHDLILISDCGLRGKSVVATESKPEGFFKFGFTALMSRGSWSDCFVNYSICGFV